MTGQGSLVNDPERRIAIGVVRKPHGVLGQCAVSGFGSTLSQLCAPVKLWLGRDEQTAREITVNEIRENPKGFICSFDGVNDMDSAGAFRDQMLFCGSESLPRLDKGRHYSFEMERLAVVAEEDGGRIGIVAGVENYPTIDCLEVTRDNGTAMTIAMTPGVIKAVDTGKGTITVSRSAIEELLA
jgi:16S rRNA processing protein RimM